MNGTAGLLDMYYHRGMHPPFEQFLGDVVIRTNHLPAFKIIFTSEVALQQDIPCTSLFIMLLFYSTSLVKLTGHVLAVTSVGWILLEDRSLLASCSDDRVS